jgi:hypothetical protein
MTSGSLMELFASIIDRRRGHPGSPGCMSVDPPDTSLCLVLVDISTLALVKHGPPTARYACYIDHARENANRGLAWVNGPD